MTHQFLLSQLALGEDSTRQFKADVRNAESLASEMAAFANTNGGAILIGAADDGSTPGLSSRDVARINQLISNAASQLVRSPLAVQTENMALNNGRIVIVLTVPKGIDKPYFDKNGVIWLKAGADKRRVNSKEALRRLFQFSNQFHADELPTKAGIDKLDKLRFRDFLRDVYNQAYPDSPAELTRLLQNMNLVTDDGRLNLAGVLMFIERPEWIVPQFVLKAIRYPGNRIHVTEYVDTEDFSGPLPKIFDDALGFVMRNLHKTQAGRGVNAPGTPEIAQDVFEELLVNALVHRDYLVSAPIRLFIFDNRIEILSPGHLPNNLTVEKIRTGNSNIRNPILVSYVAKGLLPYHGLGSGIKRALEQWPSIDFIDDHDGCLFTTTVHRKPAEELELVNDLSKSSPKSSPKTKEKPESVNNLPESSPKSSPIGSPKTEDLILDLIRSDPAITVEQMRTALGITKRAVLKQIDRLKAQDRLRRIGPARGGHWEIPE
ncbi:MAG: putative DNA binding domain-containing protein [Gammaproteobacteria bacterium]|nr:putative DNA binding domain-containing protein [Gammaproteobacteria bacterium]NNJ84334.1 ATP-dependent DNA helicase RecG [Gammaproteobacteria bacterium]